jgi:subtilisin family serine protease
VGATRPDGTVAEFSTHNRYVSLVAPGAGPSGCAHGVLSTIPHGFGTSWDGAPGEPSCSRVYTSAGARYAYAEGTSASAPIVAGIAALTWQIEPRLASEQVAKVLMRSARQIRGERRWNEFSGTGIVDGAAATALAAVYDVTDPRARGRARRVGDVLVRARVRRTRDRTEAGRELAGGIRYGLVMSLNGGRSFPVIVSGRRRPFTKRVRLRGKGLNVLLATACDSAGNCGVKRLGGFRAR